MQQKPIYFKTDFKVFVKTEAGFAVPFRFELYTNSPSRPFVARYDGKTYHNCQLLEDGRLLIALDQHGMGLGKLMVKQFYYLNDKDYSDGVCDRVIDPRPVIDLSNKNNPCEIILSLQGDDQIEFTTELPPYYQQGLTPEEHEALINETNAAHKAAASANEEAENAKEQTEASKKQMEEVNADYTKLKGDLQKAYTDTTTALAKDYTDKKAALDADYAAKKQALENDYTSVKNALGQDYTETKTAIANEYAQKQTALSAEYQAKQEALAADYVRDLKSLNDRMTAIESQYAIDKAAWQKQTTDFIAECRSTFTTNEAARQKAASDQRKAEKQTFDAQIAAQDTTFQNKEVQRDAAVEEATKVSGKVQRTQNTLGPYTARPSLALVIDKDNMAIDATTGKPVAKTGWAISKPITIVRGNEYLIKVGTTDGNVWCAAKQTIDPAWDEEVKDPETGEVIDIIHHPEEVYYSKKVQLNAGAELSEDGKLRVLGMPKDFEMVVSFHKATADTTVEVLRDGLTANICTQVGEVDTAAEESLDANMQNVAENVGNVGAVVDALEYRIGQYPQTLLGHGTPSASARPINLGNDKHTGFPLPWLGTPEFVGQMYVDIDASNGGLYYAIPVYDTYGNITSLKWGNANS